MDYSIDYLALAFWLIVGIVFLTPMYLYERRQNERLTRNVHRRISY